MKTKREYIKDLELDEDSQNDAFDESIIKSQWRKLTKKYHPDNGTEKNDAKFKEITEACNALISGKFADEPIKLNKQTAKDILDKLNNNFMGIVNKASTNIDLKKSDFHVTVVGNRIVNIDASELTKERYIKFPDGSIFRFRT